MNSNHAVPQLYVQTGQDKSNKALGEWKIL